jgi:hypothetical protein
MNIKIIKECSQFIKESQGKPLVKFLPAKGSDSRRIKVRWKKSDSRFNELFNSVFSEQSDLRNRCILSHGKTSLAFLPESNDSELAAFYVLPINGYQYLYSSSIFDSKDTFSGTLSRLYEQMGAEQAESMFTDILKFNYTSENLAEGIDHGCEIIIYGIPYYYAIRTSTVKSYSTLFSL